MAYAKRYAGGFADNAGGATPIDSVFLNAVETALLELLSADGSVDGQVMQWIQASSKFGPALLLNKNVDAAAAIAKSKLDFTGGNGIVNADIAGSAAIAKSKLAALGIVDADVSSISMSKINGLGLYRKTTSKTVNTTVAATDLLNGEITVAAGAMGTTGTLRLTAWGDWINNSASTVASPRFQAVFGGTTLLDTNISGTGISDVKRNAWRLVLEILNLGAANSQMSHMDLRLMVDGASTLVQNVFLTGSGILTSVTSAGQVVFGEGVNPSTAVDTSLAKALVLNVINGSASASYETKLFGALVEIL